MSMTFTDRNLDCQKQTYLAHVVCVSLGEHHLRHVRDHVSLHLLSLPSSNVIFLWRETEKRKNKQSNQQVKTEQMGKKCVKGGNDFTVLPC